MKIAIIKCSGSLNVGNEFINMGGIFALKQAFHNSEFVEYEFFDSAIPQNFKYPTNALLDYSKKQIEKECDLMFVLSGCILSKYTRSVLEELSSIKVKKILLGAGSYQYDDCDKALAIEMAKKFDYIYTRDDETFLYFKGAENVFSGIDLAFFAKNACGIETEKGNYALINIDLISKNLKRILKEKKSIKEKFQDVYIIENTTQKYNKVRDFLYIGYSDNLYNTIAHSSYVLTNRIHTAVCCLSNLVAFKYIGSDDNKSIGRSTLFSRFGFDLVSGKEYSVEELEKFQSKIDAYKVNLINHLKETFLI